MANTKNFWFPIRPLQWVAEPSENFSCDALKAYLGLCCIGASNAKAADEKVSFSKSYLDSTATRIFANELDRIGQKARLHHAVQALEAKGLIVRNGERRDLCGSSGEPYRRTVSRDPKRGNFIMGKQLLCDTRPDGTPAPILNLDSEESLMLLLLWHGSRWTWGGVHQQYVQKNVKGQVVIGSTVLEVLEATRHADRHNGFGLTTDRTPEQILASLVEKGFFVWLLTLLAHSSDKRGHKLSTQRTVILASNLQHDRAVDNGSYSEVLVPCVGYTLGEFQPEIVKAVYCRDLEYQDPSGKPLSFSDCSALKLWGVEKWKIGAPRK